MKLNSTFRKISQQFNIDFRQLAAEISHNQSAGEAREAALRKLLTNYLPKRVGVDSGFVIDARGNESKQIDIVIYDKTVGTVFEIGEKRFFPCEIVVAVGEVKSDIESTAKLQDALDKIRSVKELDRSNHGENDVIIGPGITKGWIKFDPIANHRDQIFGFVFTDTTLTRENVINYLQECNSVTERRFWINLFCAFNELLISYEVPKALYPSAMKATSFYCTKLSEKDDLLLLFYCILATFVSEAHVAKPSYFSYADIDRTDATYHDLFGEKECT